MKICKDENLVTIIVPAYNVENYIEQCIFSILNQTYKNIEVIVVNDGSTDNTGNILESIKQKDNRLKVINKENAGVSAARNSAMDIAEGNYFVFVDADDYIANDYVNYMIELIKDTDADFCLSMDCFTKNNEKQTNKEIVKILSSSEGTALLLSSRVKVGCWNKIYKKSLLNDNNIKFLPELYYGEGLNFIINVAQYANAIAVGNKKVYYYRKNNLRSATTQFNVDNIINGEKSLKIIEETLIFKTEPVKTMLLLHECMYCMGAIVRIKNNKCKKQYIDLYNRYMTFLRENLNKILSSKKVSLYRKLLLLTGSIFPSIIAKLDLIRSKKIVKDSI